MTACTDCPDIVASLAVSYVLKRFMKSNKLDLYKKQTSRLKQDAELKPLIELCALVQAAVLVAAVCLICQRPVIIQHGVGTCKKYNKN